MEVVNADVQVCGGLVIAGISIDFQYIDVVLSNDAIMVLTGRLLPGNEDSSGVDRSSLYISRWRRWCYVYKLDIK